MPVLSDIAVSVAPEEIQRALSRGKRDRGWFRGKIAGAIEEAIPLLRTRVAFEWADVVSVKKETVQIRFDNGPETRLEIGPNVHLLHAARRALAFVSTVGHLLEQSIQAKNESGDLLGGHLLDCVGVVALSKVSESANAMAESAAKERGWGVGARLGPGSLAGWEAARQRELCDCLPLADAGITLTESGLLRPFKSASGLIPMGPDYPETAVGSVCGLCRLAGACWRRR
ncbi:MAG: hypothetical protein ACLFPR_06525 [Desulfococcaceae bacterium]